MEFSLLCFIRNISNTIIALLPISFTLTTFWLSLAVSGPTDDGGGIVPTGVLGSKGFINAGRCCNRGGCEQDDDNI